MQEGRAREGSVSMISIEIPGRETLKLEHLVLDVNGTIVVGGRVVPGIPETLAALSSRIHVVAVTADARGMAPHLRELLGIEVHVIPASDEARAKREFIQGLGSDRCIAIGNGGNDVLMLQAAAVGVAVIGGEGAATACVLASDIVVNSISDALALVTDPLRLSATLRA